VDAVVDCAKAHAGHIGTQEFHQAVGRVPYALRIRNRLMGAQGAPHHVVGGDHPRHAVRFGALTMEHRHCTAYLEILD